MKTKSLLLLLVTAVSCGPHEETPGVSSLFNEIQASPSHVLYFYNIQSLPDEINVLDLALKATDSASNPGLHAQIRLQLDRANEMKDSLDKIAALISLEEKQHPAPPVPPGELKLNYPDYLKMMAVPPQCKRLPCPGDTFYYSSRTRKLCFFSRDSTSGIRLFRNDTLVAEMTTGTYFRQVGLRTIEVPADLKFIPGNHRLEFPVRFLDEKGTIQTIHLSYKEPGI